MSKYPNPYRPVEKRGDPVGPPLEQLVYQERLRALKEGKKNFDPRFGGPVFRQPVRNWRAPWDRWPRAWVYSVVFVMMGSVYFPMMYYGYKGSKTPLTEIEKHEAKVVNEAREEKFGGTWKQYLVWKFREK